MALKEYLKNLKILPLTSSDLEQVASLQPEGWGDILGSIQYYCISQFCHPIKATVEGKTVGIGTAIVFGSTAWLAHIIVHKEYRNAGIGTAITSSLIELIRDHSCATMLLIATALGEPVYRKLGFTVDTQYVFLDHGKLPAPADEKFIPFHPQYYKALLQFDQRISGEGREKLLGPHLSNSKLFLDGDEIRGIYIPSLGEGFIAAVDSYAGTEFMKHKWSLNKMFCVPVENELGIEFLKAHGFKEVRKASRMILGEKIKWNGSNIYSRIGGNLG